MGARASGRRAAAARSRPIPRYKSQVAAQQDRYMPEKKPVRDGLGQITQTRCLAFRSRNCYQIFTNFHSFSFHSEYFFASIIQVLLFMRSYFVFFCVSSVFWFSLKSSSHLFLGLPACLQVLMLLSSPGCQSKTLLVHLFLRRETSLLAIRHFSLLCISIQHGISCFLLQMFFSLFGAAFDVFDPIFFFFSGVNFLFDILLEGHIAVLVLV